MMAEEELTALHDALDANDRKRAIQQLPATLDAFNSQRQQEKALDKVANNVKTSAPGSELVTAATEYLNAVMVGEQSRIAVDASLATYIEDGTAVENSLEAVESSIEAHKALAEAKSTFSGVLEEASISVPPVLVFTGLEQIEFPKGLDRSYEYTLSNMGGKSATGITIEIATDLSVEVDPTQLGQIDPRSEIPVEVSGTPTTTGVSTVELSAITDDGEETSMSITVGVASVSHYLKSGLQQVKQLKSEVNDMNEESSNGSSQGNGLNGLEAMLQAVVDSLQQAIIWIEVGKQEQPIDNKIGAAINQFEAFINQLLIREGKQIESGDAQLLRHNAEKFFPVLRRQ